MSLSSNIRFYRKRSGLTQIELAEKMGISIATLRRWEAGETSPTGAKISELADIFQIAPEKIIAVGKKEEAKNDFEDEANKNLQTEGMLVYEGEGMRIELPPTDKGYTLFNKIIDEIIRKKNQES